MYIDKCECGELISEELFILDHDNCNYQYCSNGDNILRVSYKSYIVNKNYSILTYYSDINYIHEFLFNIETHNWSKEKKVIEHGFGYYSFNFENLNIIIEYLKNLKDNIIFI